MRGDARRDALGRSQGALLRALVAREPVPDGFREDRVRTAGDSLLRKRCRTVSRIAPGVALQAGTGFVMLFLEYAARNPLRERESARDDAAMFAKWFANKKKSDG